MAFTIHPTSRHIKTSIFSLPSCSTLIPQYAYILFGNASNEDTVCFYASNLQTNSEKFCEILCDHLCTKMTNLSKVNIFSDHSMIRTYELL